jgi:hypothetical protein
MRTVEQLTRKKISMLIFIIFLALLAGCTEQEQSQLRDQIVEAGKTAIAEVIDLGGAEAAKLKETAIAAAGTEIAKVRETAAATISTPVADGEKYQREFSNIAAKDRFLIGAYFYPWYGAKREHWKDGYMGDPVLGEYDSSDALVINRQIDWATGHGIDFFAISWWGSLTREDIVLRDSILKSELAEEIQFVILYESTGRLRRMVDGSIDFDDPQNRTTLIDDFTYIQNTYWKNSQYLRFAGRPVVILYLPRIYRGDVSGALETLRKTAQGRGDNVFIIGDEVYWSIYHPAEPERLRLFDAVTAYNMHASESGIAHNFSERVKEEYLSWKKMARNNGVYFIPGIIPGFNDTKVRPEENHPPIPRNLSLFAEQLDVGFELADTTINMVLINSWNEWHEDTSIEPEKSYGFDYLDLLVKELSSR